MKRYLKFVPVAGALAALLAAGTCAALEPEQLFEKVSPAVWLVRTYDAAGRPIAQGSAVVVGRGELVTNCHVLSKASGVTIWRRNVIYVAKLEFADVGRDLCLLKADNFTVPAVEIAPQVGLKIGERVFAIGSPLGLETTLSEGLISGLRGEFKSDPGSHVIQTTAPISPGSSGGGLFDSDGRLVGITFYDVGGQNLNLALPATWIAEVPARAKAALAKRAEQVQAVVKAGGIPGYPPAGAEWVYRYTEQGLSHHEAEIRVYAEHVNRDSVEESISSSGGAVMRRVVAVGGSGFFRYRIDREASLVEFSPYLLAGRGGKAPDSVDTGGYSGRKAGKWATEVKAQEWEQVSVPAGSYRALHYELVGELRNPMQGGIRAAHAIAVERFQVDAWYAPAVGRIVKLEHRGWSSFPDPVTDDVIELTKYRAQ